MLKKNVLMLILCLSTIVIESKNKVEDLYLGEIDNQSDGNFGLYQVGKNPQYMIFPHSTLDLSDKKVVLNQHKVNVYPINGAFQSIFIERGKGASGSCVKSSGPFMVSFWYGYPSPAGMRRIYEQFCMIEGKRSAIGLRIFKDGTVALYAMEGLKQADH